MLFTAKYTCINEPLPLMCLLLAVQEAAIKKMDMQASKEFLAELKVLTHVHHLNLVMHFLFLMLGKVHWPLSAMVFGFCELMANWKF